jgi:hypothetical protein
LLGRKRKKGDLGSCFNLQMNYFSLGGWGFIYWVFLLLLLLLVLNIILQMLTATMKGSIEH